jgi:RHS repeat-associated protein
VRFQGTTVEPIKKAVVSINQSATISGSVTAGDVIGIVVHNQALSAAEVASYTVQPGDTLTLIATGIAAVINGNSNLAAIGVTATSTGAIVNIASTSANATTYSSTVSGGATEAISLTQVQSKTAALSWSESFTSDPVLAAGSNTALVTAVSGGGTPVTNTHKISVNSGSSSTLTYDANGNMTSDGTNTYLWDAENRLIQVTYPGTGNNSQFTYDGFGRCVKIVETVSSSVTSTKQFVWYGNDRCEARDGSGNLFNQYFSYGHVSFSGGTGTSYPYTKDHLGSIREVNNSSGTIVYQQSFDPYGQVTVLVSTTPPDFGYAGYYVHQRSGLSLTLYRAYSSNLGRWLSRDPIEETGGDNLFVYAGNSPIRSRDPLGLKCPDMTEPMSPQDMIFVNQGGANSPSEAALEILKIANPRSISEDVEYGGSVYRDPGTGYYFSTTPIRGESRTYDPLSVGTPADAQVVGDYHTHGATGMNEFTMPDKAGNTGRSNFIPGYQGYLGTPSGQFFQYNPVTGVTTGLGR